MHTIARIAVAVACLAAVSGPARAASEYVKVQNVTGAYFAPGQL